MRVPLARTRYIVSDSPVHANGREFNEPMEIAGAGLWVETMVDRRQAKSHAVKLLDDCGVPPTSVEVLVDDFELPEREHTPTNPGCGNTLCGCLATLVVLIIVLCMTCLGGDDRIREECGVLARETAMTEDECNLIYDLWPR